MNIINLDQHLIRSFSCHLRFFQFSIQALLCQLITRIDSANCSSNMSGVNQPLAIILFFFNLIGLAVIKCSKVFNRKLFLVGFGINILLVGIMMLVGLLGIGETNSCANNKVMNRFIGF